MLPVITGHKWRELKAAKEEQKIAEEDAKAEKKRLREEKKRLKELNNVVQKQKPSKKRKCLQPKEKNSSDSHDDEPLPLDEPKNQENQPPKNKRGRPKKGKSETALVVEKYAKNSYVVVQYNSTYFPGEILTYDSEDDEYEIKTMCSTHYAGQQVWKWPVKDDVLYYKRHQILKSIENPKPLTSNSRSNRAEGLFAVQDEMLA